MDMINEKTQDALEQRLRAELCTAAHRMYESGFSPANGGNISARLGENAYLITPSGVCKRELTPDALIKMDGTGRVLSGAGKPSSEFRVHMRCYRERADVMAVCHTHSPFGVAFSAMEADMNACYLPEQMYYLGEVARCPYAQNGTQAVADSLLPYIHDHNVLLLGSHGPVAVGGSIGEAYTRAEELEHYLKVLWIANAMGGLKPMCAQDRDAILEKMGKKR